MVREGAQWFAIVRAGVAPAFAKASVVALRAMADKSADKPPSASGAPFKIFFSRKSLIRFDAL